MTGHLYISTEKIGDVNFKVIDESMGVIGGILIPNQNYQKYQMTIQAHYERNGVSNILDFDYIIILDNKPLNPVGGIGVTDSKEFNETYVDAAGLDRDVIEKIRKI